MPAAYRRADLRPATDAETARLEHGRRLDARVPGGAGPVPLQVVDGQVVDGPEHALAGDATLCGIAVVDLQSARHLFQPETRFACARCAAAD
jgi:hypothetical protein